MTNRLNDFLESGLKAAEKRGIQVMEEPSICELHGTYMSKVFKSFRSQCPDCKEEKEKQEQAKKAEELAKAKEAALIDRLEASGIAPRFMRCTLDNYEAKNQGQQKALKFAQDFVSGFEDVLTTGRSAVFVGTPGTGKTHLASAIAQAVARRYNASFCYVTVLRAMRAIKATWREDSEQSESDVVWKLTSPDLLILDEVGVQFGSEFEKNILFDVINYRYEHRKPTIFLSNLSAPELTAYLGERVVDRLREDGGAVIPFQWESNRGKR